MSHLAIKNIMVVDDDDVFRTRLARAFRDREYEVFEAATSKEVYEKMETQKIDRIVLDLKLGQESGLSLLERVSKISNAKIVVLTGYGTIGTAVDAVKLGAVNYLTKPVNADTILAAFESKSLNRIETPQLAQVEWDHIQRVVSDHNGNITKASKALGLHRRSLQRKLAKNPTKLK